MKLETFFEKFELFADAPNAVAKMRELVLQLAVRGSLTEQSDEETSRPQLARAENFRIQRGKRSEPDLEDVPFLIPDNWGWVAVGDSMNMINGRAFKPEEWTTEGTPIIRIQNLNNPAASFNYCKLDLDPKIRVHDGDFLISWSGTPGTSFGAFIWNRGFAYLNQHIFRCELVEGVFEKEFLRLAVNARLDEMISHAQGAVGLRHITKGKLEGIRLPLPPLPEQKRIVAKVDELMALCDRLEAQQQERDTRHAALARASLARFAEAPTPANLDFLFHNSYTITPADLRKSILTFAIEGRLVERDISDKTTSEILESEGISGEALNDAPQLPDHWAWVRLGSITTRMDSGWSPACLAEPTPKRSWGVLKTTAVQALEYQEHQNKALPPNLLPRPEHEVMDGDILFTRAGPMNRVGILCVARTTRTKLMISDKIIRFHLAPFVEPDFAALALNAGYSNSVIESLKSGMAASQVNISQPKLKSVPIPIPPLAEQRRIVAKVDQLMALANQLEAQLSQAKVKSAALLDAVIHELLNPTAEVIDLTSYRAAIGCYAIQKMQDKAYFGRTAAMKALYLAEAHVGLKLGLKPLREAAGPFDKWIYSFEKQGQQENWFKVNETSIRDGKTKVEYQIGPEITQKSVLVEKIFSGNQRKEFDRLLGLLSDKNTEEAEIIATLFAAWNDFLVDGHTPSDDEIVREVRENWHQKKARFTPAQLNQWIGWLRQNNLIPQGRLPRTAYQQQLISS